MMKEAYKIEFNDFGSTIVVTEKGYGEAERIFCIWYKDKLADDEPKIKKIEKIQLTDEVIY